MKRKTFIREMIRFAEENDPSVIPFIEDYLARIGNYKWSKVEKEKKPKNRRKKAGYQVPVHFTKETYAQYLETPLWREIRDKVLQARGRRCEGCDSTQKLQVHHSIYKRTILTGKSLRGLRVVCETCHGKIHALKGIDLAEATRKILDTKPYVYNPTIKIYKSTTNEVEVLKKMAKKIKY